MPRKPLEEFKKMASAYKASIHRGFSTNLLVAVNFADGANPLKSSCIMYNVWDNPCYVRWLLAAGFSDQHELDPNWQPIIIPLAATGFNIISITPGLHARYQIIAMA